MKYLIRNLVHYKLKPIVGITTKHYDLIAKLNKPVKIFSNVPEACKTVT